MHKKTFLKIIPTFLLSTLFLYACGASSSTNFANTDTIVSETGADDSFDNSRSYEQDSFMVDYSSEAGGGEMDGSYDVSGTGDSENSALTEDDMASAQAQTSNERKLIRTVNISLQTTDFDSLISDITTRTQALGGYLESSYVYNGDDYSDGLRSASYTARIPSDSLDEFLNSAFSNGVVISRNENVEDVTLSYTDLEARVETLEAERTRLMELLGEAQDVDAVIALESRLSEVRYELESIQSSLKIYDNQVDYCSVYINVSEVRVTLSTSDSFSGRIVSGFQRNLLRLLDTLTDLLIWFITNLPALVLAFIVIFAVYRLIKWIFRRKKKKLRSRDDSTFSQQDSSKENNDTN